MSIYLHTYPSVYYYRLSHFIVIIHNLFLKCATLYPSTRFMGCVSKLATATPAWFRGPWGWRRHRRFKGVYILYLDCAWPDRIYSVLFCNIAPIAVPLHHLNWEKGPHDAWRILFESLCYIYLDSWTACKSPSSAMYSFWLVAFDVWNLGIIFEEIYRQASAYPSNSM